MSKRAIDMRMVEPSLREVDFGSLTIPDAMEQLLQLQCAGKPVVPVRFHNEVAWLVLTYDAVVEAFMNEEDLPAAGFFERYTLPWLGRTVISMRGATHRAHRNLLGAPLLASRIRERATEVLLAISNDLIDRFGDRREVDFVRDYSKIHPFRVITRLLDLPAADESVLHEYVSQLFRFPWDPEGAARARDAMLDYLRPIALARRKAPRKDLISYLASTAVDGQLLNESDLLDFIRFLYPVAEENTVNGLGLLIYRVLLDREVYDRVLKNPADRAAAVEETLRIDPPVPLIARYTEKPVKVAGADIPEGSPVLYAIGAANHDPEYFDHPDKFSLDRGMINHVTFGRGPHFCLGAHLARAEMRATLDMMLDRLPGLRLVDPSTIRFHGALQRGPTSLRIAFDEICSV